MLIRLGSSTTIKERPVLFLAASVSEELAHHAGKILTLQFGLSQYEVLLSPDILSQNHSELLFPQSHKRSLSGTHYLSLHFSKEKETLYLGPVIAVITDRAAIGASSLGKLEQYYRELQMYTQGHGGLFYLTDSSLLDRQKGLIFKEESEEWIESSVPLPDVLYNRIHSRKTDRSERVKQLLSQMEEQSAFMFNTSYLNKDYVHELLSGENHLIEYLPDTRIFTRSTLESMLDKYEDVYIKHKAGSQGRNLIRLSLREKKYVLKQNFGHETVQSSFKNLSETAAELSRLKVSSNYIIQETIPLLQSGNRALDFRFLCHLADPKQWRLISSVARISGENQFVSNIAQGGELMKPRTILSDFFGSKEALRIYKIMEELALSACTALTGNSPLSLGELGIDIGVDETGKPWLIEVNSKPSKQTFSENSSARPSVRTLYHLSKSVWEERRTRDD